MAASPQRSAIFDLVGRIPLTAHGVGLSIGTDEPLDLAYLDEVAAVVERLEAPAYSEHLAFTRVPGRDLANLLPLPKTEAVAESIIAKVRTVRSRVAGAVPAGKHHLHVRVAGSKLSDAEFLNLICRETGAGLLLDIENLYLNASNHGFDPYAFLDALPAGLVQGSAHGGWHHGERRRLSPGRCLPIPIQPSGSRRGVRSPRPCARAPEPGDHHAGARRPARRRR